MPWIRIDYRYSDVEWQDELQRQIEEADRQERLKDAFQAHSANIKRKPQQGREARNA